MRTLALVLSVSLAACSWGEFSDLAGTTWVTSTEKPDIKSSDYAIGIVRAKASGDGGSLGVLGNGEATFSTIDYAANGDAKPNTGAPTLSALFGIGTLDTQPIFLHAPDGDVAANADNVTIVANSGGSSIAFLYGSAGVLKAGQVFGPQDPDAATYMRAGMASDPEAEVLVAANGNAYLAVPMPPMGFVQPQCKLIEKKAAPADPEVPVQVKAMAALANGAVDDILVWTLDGKLLRYPNSIAAGCVMTGGGQGGSLQALSDGVDTTFKPSAGSQILMIGGRYAVLQGHDDNGDGFLGLYDGTTQAALGAPVTVPKLYSADVMTIGTTAYVVAGYPTADVGGVNAGEVIIYALDGTAAAPTAINPSPALVLNDAQPDANQTFGRCVTVMPFNGQPTIAVAAANEVFLYFQTDLYPETRQGR